MKYPDGKCEKCGGTPYETVAGTIWCPNCEQRAALGLD